MVFLCQAPALAGNWRWQLCLARKRQSAGGRERLWNMDPTICRDKMSAGCEWPHPDSVPNPVDRAISRFSPTPANSSWQQLLDTNDNTTPKIMLRTSDFILILLVIDVERGENHITPELMFHRNGSQNFRAYCLQRR